MSIKDKSSAINDRGCCLIFHRGIETDEWASMPNRGFHLDLGYLERMINYVRGRGWDIVSLDEALLRISHPGHRRFVNFSIDDCYRDTAELVVPLFQRLEAPVTLFVTTGIPDETLRMRDAGLETLLRHADHVDDDEHRYALTTDRQRRTAFKAISARWEARDGDAAYLRMCRRLGDDPDRLDALHRITWPMLESLRDLSGVEIGAHTMSHHRISGLSQEEATTELLGSKTRLQDVLGTEVRHFAFPYGQTTDCGPRDFSLAHQSGFSSASTTRKGLVALGTNPYSLPRHTINGTHRHLAFAQAHLSGLSGLAAKALRRG